MATAKTSGFPTQATIAPGRAAIPEATSLPAGEKGGQGGKFRLEGVSGANPPPALSRANFNAASPLGCAPEQTLAPAPLLVTPQLHSLPHHGPLVLGTGTHPGRLAGGQGGCSSSSGNSGQAKQSGPGSGGSCREGDEFGHGAGQGLPQLQSGEAELPLLPAPCRETCPHALSLSPGQ